MFWSSTCNRRGVLTTACCQAEQAEYVSIRKADKPVSGYSLKVKINNQSQKSFPINHPMESFVAAANWIQSQLLHRPTKVEEKAAEHTVIIEQIREITQRELTDAQKLSALSKAPPRGVSLQPGMDLWKQPLVTFNITLGYFLCDRWSFFSALMQQSKCICGATWKCVAQAAKSGAHEAFEMLCSQGCNGRLDSSPRADSRYGCTTSSARTGEVPDKDDSSADYVPG